ncbi:MAG: NAD-dependent epimerase/dehydratase family protein [Candidatus Aenigmarchaeota archaeon]|nr:NAD-dependent epimerase/dehydratase family protein [Candidatus Aenigmarchaeota archaeon]
MKRILVTGAAGQIGSELVPILREIYGNENVVAAGHNTRLPADLMESGPYTTVNVADYFELDREIKWNDIGRIYHLSSILSAKGEQNPELAYAVNIGGLKNVLDVAKGNDIEQVLIPSSIAAFGPETPKENTPNDTVQKPRTMYGISKVFQELLGQYYFEKYDLDVRGVRFPGIISWKTEPTAGTTDYAVAIFYEAIRNGHYTSYLKAGTRLPMMYMPDAVKALIDLGRADSDRLKHRTDFNVAAFSFTPSELADIIRERLPEFTIDYRIDPIRQAIADSWPRSLNDSAAREEWGWKPDWDLEMMADDMLEKLSKKLAGRKVAKPQVYSPISRKGV